jgi:hypothetical protein
MATQKKVDTEESKIILNAFDDNVNYKMFLESLPEGIDVELHIIENYTEEQADFLINDLKIYKNQ